MLPSSLFYRSTLLCNVPDAYAHPLAPFPLVFVCSNIDNNTSANCNDTDTREAETLVEEVNKYIFECWPLEWGEDVCPPGEVCIITPSVNQVSNSEISLTKLTLQKVMQNFIHIEACYNQKTEGIKNQSRCACP